MIESEAWGEWMDREPVTGTRRGWPDCGPGDVVEMCGQHSRAGPPPHPTNLTNIHWLTSLHHDSDSSLRCHSIKLESLSFDLDITAVVRAARNRSSLRFWFYSSFPPSHPEASHVNHRRAQIQLGQSIQLQIQFKLKASPIRFYQSCRRRGILCTNL